VRAAATDAFGNLIVARLVLREAGHLLALKRSEFDLAATEYKLALEAVLVARNDA
jgi:hypothetical protein